MTRSIRSRQRKGAGAGLARNLSRVILAGGLIALNGIKSGEVFG